MSRVWIDTVFVQGAAQHVAAAQNRTGGTWHNLADALSAVMGMAGNPGKDEAAAKFVSAYAPAAQAAWQGFAALHRSVGDMSRGLAQTAKNHAKADQYSMIGSGSPVLPRQTVPFRDRLLGYAVSPPLNLPGPPSAAGPGESAPHSLLGSLTGIEIDISGYWPTGDPNGLAQASHAWKTAQDALTDIRSQLSAEVKGILGHGDAPDIDAFENYWKRIDAGGDQATVLEGLPRLCGGISEACAQYSTALRDAQLQVNDAAGNPVAALLEVAALRATLASIAGKLVQVVGGIAVGALAEHLVTSVTIGAGNAPNLRILEAEVEREVSETLHSTLRGGDGDRDIDPKEVIENADDLYYDENGNQVFVWRRGDRQSQVTIRNPSNGNILTNQWSSDAWIQRQLDKERWYGLDD
ncbi:hypothetical protein [Actinomadura sp. NPDC048394]|uniref:WXG100-like domain-containing protein n=1 Tax=Actinomadura sp. NPDC048394 TaxID=3158223 RepID=UPI00341050B6